MYRWTVEVTRRSSDDSTEIVRLFEWGEYRGLEEVATTVDGRPLRRRRETADGDLVFTEAMRYRSDGTLRETRRCRPTEDEGETECITIRYGDGGSSWTELIETPDEVSVRRFDAAGRPTYEREEPIDRDDTAPPREVWFEYDQSGLIERRVVEGDRRERYRYADGRVVSEAVHEGRRLVRSVEREFDEEGRIVLAEVLAEGRAYQEAWEYDNGGHRMVRSVGGRQTVVEERDENDSGVTTRFRDGEAVVREIVERGEVIRREILLEGEVIRVEER